ncbi:MAG: zinc ribbon domain-containing protein [Acidobacteria bacterium]|nr:zinc ribbon domain-containing protein [Acidobacteriota bacterium]
MVPESCTCGALLPPDARFCHKCGKPQREEPSLEPVAESPSGSDAPLTASPSSAPAPSSESPAEINFRNRIALRVGFRTAGFTLLASYLTALLSFVLLSIVSLVLLPAAGFYSVHLYTKRTGYLPTPRGGARLGWITGVIVGAISLLLFSLAMVAFANVVQNTNAAEMGLPAEAYNQLVKMLEDPLQLILLSLLQFAFFAVAASLGGMIGAMILDKD